MFSSQPSPLSNEAVEALRASIDALRASIEVLNSNLLPKWAAAGPPLEVHDSDYEEGEAIDLITEHYMAKGQSYEAARRAAYLVYEDYVKNQSTRSPLETA